MSDVSTEYWAAKSLSFYDEHGGEHRRAQEDAKDGAIGVPMQAGKCDG